MQEKKRRIFDIIQIGNAQDRASRIFDIAIMVMILFNLFIAIFETFSVSENYKTLLVMGEAVTVLVFTVEYILRLWTAEYLYSDTDSKATCILRYAFSVGGLVDLLSFLPYYLPVFFPGGTVAFRLFRVVRILRLFRINAYYDAFNVITGVLKDKKDELLSSIFILLILIIASSLCMYSLEHEAQPEVFRNAFSGIWWSVSTLLTVGYGDIYPVTLAGKFFGILITFLGVGMVAIPTGILSAGFVERYTRMKDITRELEVVHTNLVEFEVKDGDAWIGKKSTELLLPGSMTLLIVKRGENTREPDANTVIRKGDRVVLRVDEERLS